MPKTKLVYEISYADEFLVEHHFATTYDPKMATEAFDFLLRVKGARAITLLTFHRAEDDLPDEFTEIRT